MEATEQLEHKVKPPSILKGILFTIIILGIFGTLAYSEYEAKQSIEHPWLSAILGLGMILVGWNQDIRWYRKGVRHVQVQGDTVTFTMRYHKLLAGPPQMNTLKTFTFGTLGRIWVFTTDGERVYHQFDLTDSIQEQIYQWFVERSADHDVYRK